MVADIRRVHAERIRAERRSRGWDKAEMARRLAQAAGDARHALPDHDSLLTYVKRWERGGVGVSERYRLLYCRAFGLDEEDLFPSPAVVTGWRPEPDDELDILELVRRVEASDVGRTTLEALRLGVHGLCRRYTTATPAELLPDIREYRRYIGDLLQGRATPSQQRELIVTAGLLSLLAACVHEDLGQRRASELCRETARRLGVHAGHAELVAWAYEIAAWQAILDGAHLDAVAACHAGLEHTGAVSSAAAQLTAQEARAWARLGDRARTRTVLERTASVVGRLDRPEWPDHHFVFDPRKLVSYTATTYAWLGDGSDEAEGYARRVIHDEEESGRPRRVATARIDLAVILAARGDRNEAAHLGRLAVDSGRLVPSNLWRVTELDRMLAAGGSRSPDVAAFHERYEQVRRTTGDLRLGRS